MEGVPSSSQKVLLLIFRRKTLFTRDKSRPIHHQSTRNFLDYDNDYVSASHVPNGSIQLLSRRYSYVDLTFQTSGNSLTGSSGELSVSTPLVNPFTSTYCQMQKQLLCCECQTSCADRKSPDGIGVCTSGSRLASTGCGRYNALQTSLKMDTNVCYAEAAKKATGALVDDNGRSSNPTAATATKSTTLQTDDVKLQRSLCVQVPPPPPLLSSPLEDPRTETIHGVSRDLEKLSTSNSSSSKDLKECAPPLHIF